jgi:hypothetical protein
MSSMAISLPAALPPASSSLSRSSSNSKPQSPSSPGPKVSVSLILAVSGSSPYALLEGSQYAMHLCTGDGEGGGGSYRERASSAEYLRITSPFSSWYSRSETRMMSPLLIQIFFRSLPRIRPRRLTPSKH